MGTPGGERSRADNRGESGGREKLTQRPLRNAVFGGKSRGAGDGNAGGGTIARGQQRGKRRPGKAHAEAAEERSFGGEIARSRGWERRGGNDRARTTEGKAEAGKSSRRGR